MNSESNRVEEELKNAEGKYFLRTVYVHTIQGPPLGDTRYIV